MIENLPEEVQCISGGRERCTFVLLLPVYLL